MRRRRSTSDAVTRSWLRLLRLRGFTVEAEVEARITACKDDAQLNTWADQVLTASSLDELLAAVVR